MTESNGNTRQHSLIRLSIISLGEGTRICELRPDSNLIVGSGRSCGLQLAGPGVSTIHAVLRRDTEQLWLQPWHGEAAIYVNGERIEGEVQLAVGDEVQIGSHRLVVDHREVPRQATAASMPDCGELPAAIQADVPTPAAPQSNLSPPACVGAESSPLDTYADDLIPDTSPHDIGLDDLSELYADDCPEGETIRLLQAEIALLQSELTERDAQLSEAADQPFSTADVTGAPADWEDTVPAARLEQSLCELQQADQRIAELERLLCLAEEARTAAWDERQQIEAWVGDIEKRIEQWLTERRAENDLLRNQLGQSKAECERLREQLQGRVQGTEETSSAQLLQLQHRYAELREGLQRIESERDRLQERLERAGADGDQRRRADLEAALREERLQLAQQRASLARERAEMEGTRAARDEVAREVAPQQDVDRRVRAFREHLREIHDEEEQENAGRGLGSRLAQLWRRLDGNGSW